MDTPSLYDLPYSPPLSGGPDILYDGNEEGCRNVETIRY